MIPPITEDALRAYLMAEYVRCTDRAHFDRYRHDLGEDVLMHIGAARALVELGLHFGIEIERKGVKSGEVIP